MNVNDTLKIFLNHSVCTFEGYEHINLIREKDSLSVQTEITGYYDYETEYVKMEKRIACTDTFWKFDSFLKKNDFRRTDDKEGRPVMRLIFQKDTLKYHTKDLTDLLHFQADFDNLMQNLFPDANNGVYGDDFIE